jgi:serine/threonine protein kinase
MEQRPLATVEGLSLVCILLLYLVQRPGVVQGFYDTYIRASIDRLNERAFRKEDFRVGRRVATGGFGEVYRAELIDPVEGNSQVILKRAKEFGEAEVWMNERCMRVCSFAIPKFITAFDETGKIGDPLWLCWVYEGDMTLWIAMQKRDFPFNIEKTCTINIESINKDTGRRQQIYGEIMRQIFENLAALHNVGIVHRDVKPQNIIVSESDRRLKMIDLGAAADLRVGINYQPNEYLLDPRYAPPQQYIMSTSTPRAPPTPLAALLSPVLWQLNKPDRFDMYSAGMVLIQMVFPSLRNDNALFAFNKRLASFRYDISRWRQSNEVESRVGKDPSLREGFKVLDLDNGVGWDLLCQLLRYKPDERISASEALVHPFCQKQTLPVLAKFLSVSRANFKKVTKVVEDTFADVWLEKEGQLTETLLDDELVEIIPRREITSQDSATLAYWKSRQAALNKKLWERRSQLSQLSKSNAARTVRGLLKKNRIF